MATAETERLCQTVYAGLQQVAFARRARINASFGCLLPHAELSENRPQTYQARIRPLEEHYNFPFFFSPVLTDADIEVWSLAPVHSRTWSSFR